MYEKERLIEALTTLGLTAKEAEVFLAILAKNGATIKDILNMVDVHQPQLYNILSSLARKGFITVSGMRPKRYYAFSLDTLIDSHVVKLQSIKETVKATQYLQGSPQVAIAHGLDGINNGIVDVLSNAQLEVYGELPRGFLLRNMRPLVNALERGVRLYLIVYPSVDKADLEPLAKYSDLVRVKATGLGDFLILASDMARGIYASRRATLGGPNTYGYMINDRDLLARLLTIFENTWREAKYILHTDPAKATYPRRYLNISLAIEDLESLISSGHRPVIRVRGIDLRRREHVEVKGVVSSTTIYNRVASIAVESGERRYTVGGYDAEIEDIEAEEIEILRLD